MTYEYVCEACGHEWEAEQPISADPLKTCPKCKKRRARRQVSGGQGFILKGGGWYADGYGSAKSGGEGKPEKSEKKDSSSSSTSESDKTKKKSDAKSDSTSDSSPKKPSSKKEASA